MNRINLSMIATACILPVLSSCTSVSVYELQPDGSLVKTGIKHYSPKPYLLVTRSGENQKVVAVKEVFLPDISRPQYGVHKPGWGKANFEFSMTNGMLTKFTNNFDGEGDEAITSIGSLAGSVGTLLKDIELANNLNDPRLTNESASSRIEGQAITDINRAKKDVEQAIIGNNAPDVNTPASVDSLSEIKDKLSNLEKNAFSASTDDMVKMVLRDAKLVEGLISGQIEDLGGNASEAKGVVEPLRTAQSKLQGAIGIIEKAIPKPKAPASPPIFELYEVLISKEGSTSLRKVKLPQ